VARLLHVSIEILGCQRWFHPSGIVAAMNEAEDLCLQCGVYVDGSKKYGAA